MAKVAFINYSLFGGGAERNAINLSAFLSERGTACDILLFKDINDYREEYASANKKVKIVPLISSSRPTPLFMKPFHFFLLFARLYLTILKNGYDVLVGVEEYDPFYFTVALARLTGKKSLLLAGNNIHAEINTKNPIVRPFFEAAFRASFRYSDRIISLSKGLTADLIRNYSLPRHKVITIYSGVDSKTIIEKSIQPLTGVQKKLFRNRPIIIALGRLVYKKGFDHLIGSYALFKKKVPTARLMIIGKGPQEANLKKLASGLKIKRFVTFCGFVKDNPYRLLKHADLFVFTSLYEGFGNTIIEAMNCGLPVLSMDCPYGPEEIVGSKYGILSPHISVSDSATEITRKERLLADKMIQLLSDKNKLRSLSRASTDRAQAFTLAIMGGKLKKAIDDLAHEE